MATVFTFTQPYLAYNTEYSARVRSVGKDEGENEWSGVSTVETSEGEEEAATEISNPAC